MQPFLRLRRPHNILQGVAGEKWRETRKNANQVDLVVPQNEITTSCFHFLAHDCKSSQVVGTLVNEIPHLGHFVLVTELKAGSFNDFSKFPRATLDIADQYLLHSDKINRETGILPQGSRWRIDGMRRMAAAA